MICGAIAKFGETCIIKSPLISVNTPHRVPPSQNRVLNVRSCGHTKVVVST